MKWKDLKPKILTLLLLLSFLSFLGFLVPPAYTTELFSSGFEFASFPGDFSGTNGSPALDTGIYHHGSKSGKFDGIGDFAYKSGLTGTTIYARDYVRLNALAGNGEECVHMRFYDSSWAIICEVNFQKYDGIFHILLHIKVPSEDYYAYVYNWAVDTWYCIQMMYHQHASNGIYKIYLGNTLIISTPTLDTSSKAASIVAWGQPWSSYTVINHVDCVVVADQFIDPEDGEPPPPPPPPSSPLYVEGKYLKDEAGNIVVLRGVNYDQGRWYAQGYWSQSQIGYIKAMSCNTVYIKVVPAWTPNCYSDNNFWVILDEMMEATSDNGLYVVYCGFAVEGRPLSYFGHTWSSWIALWETIVNRYENYSHIIYEPISEYLNTPYSTYQTQMRNCIDAIRAIDSDCVISVQSVGSGSWETVGFQFEQTHPISRSNIVFSHDIYGYHIYPDNSQAGIWTEMQNKGIEWMLNNDRCIIFSEFGGNYATFDSWSQTWVQNFMMLSDSKLCCGYGAWRWCTAAQDHAYHLLVDWSGNLATYGNVVKNHFVNTQAPTYSSVAHDTTTASQTAEFSCLVTDNVGLSGFIFSWNGTGSWANNTWTSLSGTSAWANASKTLPSGGTVVGYRWFFNDTHNNWAITIIHSFTTTGVGENIVVLLNTPSDGITTAENTQSFTYTPIFSGAIENSSLWMNVSGTWQAVAWNASTVQNATTNSLSYTFSTSATYKWNVGTYNSTHVVYAQTNRTLRVTLPPYYSEIRHSTTQPNANCNLTVYWHDGDGLSGYIFGWNGTGSMQNETWTDPWSGTPTSAWSEVQVTLPSNGTIVWAVYANDTNNGWTKAEESFAVGFSMQFITYIGGTPLEGVKINGTEQTNSAGYSFWGGLTSNVLYTFVVDPPTGYYPAWCLDVEGGFSWNGTAFFVYQNISETEQDFLEIYFRSSWDVYVKETNAKITSASLTSSAFTFKVSAASSYTSTTQIYTYTLGQPVAITPASADGGYNSGTKVQTIQWTHSSEQEITLDWTVTTQGEGFNLYFTSGKTLAFQHLATSNTEHYIFNVTVTSGIWNGTGGILTMTAYSGELKFTSQATATLQATEGTIVIGTTAKGESATIANGDSVIIRWACPTLVYDPYLPFLFIMGVIGIIGMFGGPAYTIHKVKHKEYREGFVTGLILTVSGIALFIAWVGW